MPDPEPGPADALAPVIRLRPIRTLVVTSDAAYRERALTVLSELGHVAFADASLAQPGDVAILLQDERAGVVVLDATGREEDAQRVLVALAEAAPRTGVVVVCHHCTAAARELQALPKWGWTQDLRAGVEHAYREGNPLCPGGLRPLRRRSPWQRMAGPLLRR
ncbi:MAG: hypothetical protein ACRDLN_02625 [Solirubrobacteraceae bacterium]